MAAPEASCSSRNQTVEGPLLSGSGGRMTGPVAVHESHELASDASNMSPAPLLKSVTIRLGIASNACKNNSPLPPPASSTSVIHSSWIQRLKPSSQSCTPKDEPSTFSKKEDFVCTHFSKDYSSCSRRLNKFPHHTRSSSWPPHGALLKVMGQLPMEVEEPVYAIAGEHENGARKYPILDHHTMSVPSKNATQSSEAGSTTGSQQDCQKRVPAQEGFVPCAQLSALNRHTLSLGRSKDLQDSEDRDRKKPENHSRRQLKKLIKDENKADFVPLSEQAKSQCQSQEVQSNCGYFDGSFPTFRDPVIAPGLPGSVCGAVHCSNASADADADASIFYAKPSNFGALDEKEIHQTHFRESDCKLNYPAAVVLRNKGKIDQLGLILPCEKEAVRDGFSMDARDLHFPQARQNFNLFKGAAAKAYLLNGFLTGPPNNSHLSYSNHQRARACTRDAMTAYGDDPHTVGTSASKDQNFVSRRLDASHSRRATSQNPHSGEEGQASRLPVSTESLHEDAARARIREKSLGDYWNTWVRVLKEPDHDRPINMGHSKASSQQDFAMGRYYEEFSQQPSSTKQTILNLNGWRSLNLGNSAKDTGSCNSGQQGFPLTDHHQYSGHGIKSRQLIASPDHLSNFRVDCVEVSREKHLYSYEGASGRVDSQPHYKNSGFYRRFQDNSSSHSRMHSHNERSGKEQNMHHGWLQRWQCAERFSSGSRKPSTFVGDNSRSISSDELAKLPESWSASAQCTLRSSHKDISAFEGNVAGSGRGSNRYTEASGTRLDSGSASTPASRPAGRNFAAFRSGYSRPSIEAMAIVGNSACKSHPSLLENGGFYRLPCARPKSLKCVILSEDSKDADEDKMHLLGLNDVGNLRGDIGGS